MHSIAPSSYKHTASFLSEGFVLSSKGCMMQVTKGSTNFLHQGLRLEQRTRKKKRKLLIAQASGSIATVNTLLCPVVDFVTPLQVVNDLIFHDHKRTSSSGCNTLDRNKVRLYQHGLTLQLNDSFTVLPKVTVR